MFVYAGIDEAGYGPAFGPMTVGRCVLAVPKLASGAEPPDLWARLNKAVSKTLSGRKGRIVVNDSKKLTTKAAGIKHLETGCLAFAGLCESVGQPADVGAWLDAVGEVSHRSLQSLPWYGGDEPWAALPTANDEGELAIARGLLRNTAQRIGVEVADMATAVVFEDRFNQMVAATHSKAAVSFTFVAGHLQHVWRAYGQHRPVVVVDRQSGRMRYRDVLAMNFEGCAVSVLHESPEHSGYVIEQPAAGSEPARSMTVHFETEAEQRHMPVALASMLAKYARELMMARFKAWFAQALPEVAPTAGYGSDAKRFWQEVRPSLGRLGIDPAVLRRQA